MGGYVWGTGAGDGNFNNPTGVDIDSSNNVYVVDNFNHRIQKFDSKGNYLGQWGAFGSGPVEFNFTYGIAVDSSGKIVVADTSGNVYLDDTLNNTVQKFDANGLYVTSWGGSGTSNGQFNFTMDTAVDSSGTVYVVDGQNNRVQKFIKDVHSHTFAGVWDSGAGNWEWSASKTAAGDFNGDSRDDINILYGYFGGQTALFGFLSSGTDFSPSNWWQGSMNWNASQPISGDFNGDNIDDAGVFQNSGNSQSGLMLFN